MLYVLHPKNALLLAMLTTASLQIDASFDKKVEPVHENEFNATTRTYQLTKGKILVTNLACYGAETGKITLQMDEPGWTSVLSGKSGILMTGKESVVFDKLPAGDYLISMTGPQEGETQQLAVAITAPQPEKISLGQLTPFDCAASSTASLELKTEGTSFFDCRIMNSIGAEIHNGVITSSHFQLEQLKGDVYYVEYDTGCSTGKLEADLRDEKQVNVRITSDQIHVENMDDQKIHVSIKPDLINATHCTWKLDDGTAHEGDDYVAIFDQFENHTLLFTAENESCRVTEVLSLHASDLPELAPSNPMPYASAYIENDQLRISLRQLQYAATDIKIISEQGEILWSQNIHDSQKSDSEINLSMFAHHEISVIITNHGMPILSKEFRL
ncbi:MAG: hypothetical protein K1X54_03705 [Flavobacteriales bacterium]|nr:hypothetical protein [Flavobacteriales bacterium]